MICARARKCGDVIFFMTTAPHYSGVTLRKKLYCRDEGVDNHVSSVFSEFKFMICLKPKLPQGFELPNKNTLQNNSESNSRAV